MDDKIKIEIEPVVKLYCQDLKCSHNLYQRTGEMCCNLKFLVISGAGKCTDRVHKDDNAHYPSV